MGQIAKRQAITNPHSTVYAVKRLIGRRFSDENVARFSAVAPFEICEAENKDAWIRIDGKMCSPEELSGVILRRMKETAQDFLGEEVPDAGLWCSRSSRSPWVRISRRSPLVRATDRAAAR